MLSWLFLRVAPAGLLSIFRPFSTNSLLLWSKLGDTSGILPGLARP